MTASPRRLIEGYLNSEGRSTTHVLVGAGLAAGAALVATGLAARAARPAEADEDRAHGVFIEKPRNPLSIILPALFSATTVSALRVWNAPASTARASALRVWLVTQAVNGVWLAVRPRRMAGQMLAAMTSAGMMAAYAHYARQLDRRSGVMAAPQGRGVGMVNLVSEKLARRRAPAPTVH